MIQIKSFRQASINNTSTLKDQIYFCQQIAINSNGTILIVLSLSTVALYSNENGEFIQLGQHFTTRLSQCMLVSKRKNLFIISNKLGKMLLFKEKLGIWNIQLEQQSKILDIFNIIFSKDEDQIICCGGRGKIEIWDLNIQEQLVLKQFFNFKLIEPTYSIDINLTQDIMLCNAKTYILFFQKNIQTTEWIYELTKDQIDCAKLAFINDNTIIIQSWEQPKITAYIITNGDIIEQTSLMIDASPIPYTLHVNPFNQLIFIQYDHSIYLLQYGKKNVFKILFKQELVKNYFSSFISHNSQILMKHTENKVTIQNLYLE